MTARLKGQTALVTGAGRGIGREVAMMLAGEGASVIVNDLDASEADAVVDEMTRAGCSAVAFPGSVTADDFPDALAAFVKKQLGDIHVVVNNAGYVWNSPLHRTTDDQWAAMQDVHVTAPFRILRALHPIIKASVAREAETGQPVGRRIINVASIAATRGASGQAAYSAAKSGLFGLTRSLAKEWGRMNVTVNCVAFGLVDTRLSQETDGGDISIDIDGEQRRVGFTAEQRSAIVRNIPLGRSATPREAAGGVFIFCLPEASYITGQCIEIAGGMVY